jgi:hypothetical protein
MSKRTPVVSKEEALQLNQDSVPAEAPPVYRFVKLQTPPTDVEVDGKTITFSRPFYTQTGRLALWGWYETTDASEAEKIREVAKKIPTLGIEEREA